MADGYGLPLSSSLRSVDEEVAFDVDREEYGLRSVASNASMPSRGSEGELSGIDLKRFGMRAESHMSLSDLASAMPHCLPPGSGETENAIEAALSPRRRGLALPPLRPSLPRQQSRSRDDLSLLSLQAVDNALQKGPVVHDEPRSAAAEDAPYFSRGAAGGGENGVRGRLLCSICADWGCDTYLAPCGHACHERCALKALDRVCPMCRMEVCALCPIAGSSVLSPASVSSADSESASLRRIELSAPGTVEDVYELCEEIGDGTYACIRAGRHRVTGEEVALKIVRKNALFSQEERESLWREVSTQRLCAHPCVCNVIETFETDDSFCLVLELFRGGTLAHRIANCGTLPERAVAHVAFQLLQALSYIHHLRVLHCDVKPENVVFSRKDNDSPVVLIDFGLSIVLPASTRRVPFTQQRGSYGYTAPEIICQQDFDQRVDMWSLGVLIFRSLFGYEPFSSESEAVYGEVEFPADPPVSSEAKRFIVKLLERDPILRLDAHSAIKELWFDSQRVRRSAPLRLAIGAAPERGLLRRPSFANSTSSPSPAARAEAPSMLHSFSERLGMEPLANDSPNVAMALDRDESEELFIAAGF